MITVDYSNTYNYQDMYLFCYVPDNIDLTSIEDGVSVVTEGEYRQPDRTDRCGLTYYYYLKTQENKSKLKIKGADHRLAWGTSMKNACLVFLLLVSQITLGQQSIGVNFGLPQYTWHGGTAETGSIQSESVGVYVVELEYLRPLKNTLLMGIDVGVHKISNTIWTGDQYSSYLEGFEPLYNFGVSPKLLYHLDFGESGFGGFLSIGPSLRWINAKDRNFDESNFRITGKKDINSDQDGSYQPVEQNPYQGRETVRNFSAVLRPELGLSYKVSRHSKFLIRFQYGVRMFSPLISRSFGSFELEGKQTPFRHILHSDFSALQIGYQLLLIP